MTIAGEDAASALRDVERTRRRAVELSGYAHAGDSLIGWGLVWLICNLVTQLAPAWGNNSWLIGIPAAVAWSMTRKPRGGARGGGWRTVATALTAFGFFAALMLVAGIRDPLQANALVSLCVATAYVVLGIWAGARFAWIGLALAALVLAGWFFDRSHLYLWLAFGGGGALLLSGLWLRRA
jgi:hypothetical protein